MGGAHGAAHGEDPSAADLVEPRVERRIVDTLVAWRGVVDVGKGLRGPNARRAGGEDDLGGLEEAGGLGLAVPG
jgi:hypothetical protein